MRVRQRRGAGGTQGPDRRRTDLAAVADAVAAPHQAPQRPGRALASRIIPRGKSAAEKSVGRWLIAVAVLAVLTLVVTSSINVFGGSTRDVQVPDVRNMVSADAIAKLQNAGFKVDPQNKPDSTVPPDHVIDTNPEANTSVGAGDEITLNVSTGPEQREVVELQEPHLCRLRPEAHQRGVRQVQGVPVRVDAETKDRVLTTIPPANQTSAVTNEITIVVGDGPRSRPAPDVRNQTVESAPAGPQCRQASRKTVVVDVDSPSPKGQVVGTVPPPGDVVPVDSVIQIQVSRGDQFVMPDVRGGFWTDVEPMLRDATGWTGPLIRAPNVQNSGQRPTRW